MSRTKYTPPKMETTENTSLKEGQLFVRTHWIKGCICPCCGQNVKKYERKFNAGMAQVLIRIYKIDETLPTEDKFFHIIKRARTNNGEYGMFKHWGLLEPKKDIPMSGKKASGYWRLTEKGRLFALGRINISKYIYIFDKKFFGLSVEQTSIMAALGNNFDYEELMRS